MSSGISKTHYAENLVLNALLRLTNLTAPTGLQVALFTTAPTEAYTTGSPTGVEVSGGSYTRENVTFGAPSSGATGGTVANTGAVTFPVASGSWGTVSHLGIVDGAGNLIYYGALTASIAVNSGNQFVINIGDLTVLED